MICARLRTRMSSRKLLAYCHSSVVGLLKSYRHGTQGFKFVVFSFLVANAFMFSHLLPGFSCGSKHLPLP